MPPLVKFVITLLKAVEVGYSNIKIDGPDHFMRMEF